MNEQVQTPQASPIAVLRNDLHNMEAQFKAALPAHIPVERFARVVMTAIQNNPDLARCDRRSLWNAAMKAAQDGLLPDGREGAMVPYKDQVTWLPMIAGLRKKVRNSGEIATWEVHVVHEKDDFAFELGDEPFIKHRPTLGADTGAVIGAYSVATLKTGEKSREWMSISAIEKVRARSRAQKGGPWFTDYEEMARKTVARRHSKVLPMSTDLDDLLRRDDELYDMKGAQEEAPERLKSLTGRLDALAQVGNGDIIDAVKKEPEQPSESQGATLPGHPGPATDGEPAATESQLPPGKAGVAAGEMQPATEVQYSAFAGAWIAKLTDPKAGEARWKNEAPLREHCGVSEETDDELETKLRAKCKALRSNK